MSTTPHATRDVLAAIRHDVRTGNLERARRWLGDIAHGQWDEASPAVLEQACCAIEVKLEEAGL